MSIKKIVILFSGNGSNMENLIQKLHLQTFLIHDVPTQIQVSACICNQENAYGITRAKNLQIPCIILPHEHFSTRQDFDHALAQHIKILGVDLVVLSGFMRILSPFFTKAFKIINIHPSLLPKYKGAHAIKESFLSQDLEVGVSVHWVNEALDAGELILQERILRDQNDDFQTFSKKIHQLEYQIYPQAVLLALKML